MGQTRPFTAALITLLALTACSHDAALNAYAEFGISVVADLQARNFDAIETQVGSCS